MRPSSHGGLLDATPHEPTVGGAGSGVLPISPCAARPGLLAVPPGYRPERPAPLLAVLHGAGDAAGVVRLGAPLAAAIPDAILVAPESVAATWDVIASRLGPDPRRARSAPADLRSGRGGHGTRDRVLPIGRPGRRVVGALAAEGHEVRHRELDGGHAVPGDVQELEGGLARG